MELLFNIDWDSVNLNNIPAFEEDPVSHVCVLLRYCQWDKILSMDWNLLQNPIMISLQNKEVTKHMFDQFDFDSVAKIMRRNHEIEKLFLDQLETLADNFEHIRRFGNFLISKYHIYGIDLEKVSILLDKDKIYNIISSWFDLNSTLRYDISLIALQEALTGNHHFKSATSKSLQRAFLLDSSSVRKDYISCLLQVTNEAIEFIKTSSSDKSIKFSIFYSYGNELIKLLPKIKDQEVRTTIKTTLKSLAMSVDSKILPSTTFVDLATSEFNDLIHQMIHENIILNSEAFQHFFVDHVLAAIESGDESSIKSLMMEEAIKNPNLMRKLKASFKENTDSKEGKIYSAVLDAVVRAAADTFIAQKSSHQLDYALSILNMQNGRIEYSLQQVVLDYDETMSIVMAVIKKVQESKNHMNMVSDDAYPEIVCHLILQLTGTKYQQQTASVFDVISNEELSTYRTVFEQLPVDIRDSLILDSIRHPKIQGKFAPWITQRLPHVLMRMILKLSSVSSVRELVPESKRGKIDQYGFIEGSDQKSLFESFLMASDFMKSSNITIFQGSISIYKSFVEKILREAYLKDDEELMKRASASHRRLCYLLLSVENTKFTTFTAPLIIELVSNPLAIAIGTKLNPNFPKEYFNGVILNISFDDNWNAIIHRLIYNSHCQLLPELDGACAVLIEQILNVMDQSFDYSTNFKNYGPNYLDLSFLNKSDYNAFVRHAIDTVANYNWPQWSFGIGADEVYAVDAPPFPSNTFDGYEEVFQMFKCEIGGKTIWKIIQYINSYIEKYNYQMYNDANRVFVSMLKEIQFRSIFEIERYVDIEEEEFTRVRLNFNKATIPVILKLIDQNSPLKALLSAPDFDIEIFYKVLHHKEFPSKKQKPVVSQKNLIRNCEVIISSLEMNNARNNQEQRIRQYWTNVHKSYKAHIEDVLSKINTLKETLDDNQKYPEIPKEFQYELIFDCPEIHLPEELIIRKASTVKNKKTTKLNYLSLVGKMLCENDIDFTTTESLLSEWAAPPQPFAQEE